MYEKIPQKLHPDKEIKSIVPTGFFLSGQCFFVMILLADKALERMFCVFPRIATQSAGKNAPFPVVFFIWVSYFSILKAF